MLNEINRRLVRYASYGFALVSLAAVAYILCYGTFRIIVAVIILMVGFVEHCLLAEEDEHWDDYNGDD